MVNGFQVNFPVREKLGSLFTCRIKGILILINSGM